MKLPKGWELNRLGDICDVRDGTHDSPKYQPKGYPLVTSKNLTSGRLDFLGVNYISKEDFEKINLRSKVDVGDIIMPMIGTIGNPIIVETDEQFAIKNVALIKFTKSNVLNKYIHFLLKSPFFDTVTSKTKRGGTQKFIALGDIRNIKIPLPPPKTQHRIVSILKKAEQAKEWRKEADELTKEFLKAVFSEMFGDLTRNNEKWTLKKMGDICYFENGDRGINYPSDHSKDDSGVPFINAGNLSDGAINKDGLDYITLGQYNKLSGGKLKIGDFVFCLRGSLGKFAFNRNLPKGAIASSLVIIRPSAAISPEYLSYYFRSSLCNNLIKKYDSSSSQPNLSANSVKSFNIPLPPIELQNKFASIVQEVEDLKEQQKSSKEQTDNLFSALLQKAFTGELVA